MRTRARALALSSTDRHFLPNVSKLANPNPNHTRVHSHTHMMISASTVPESTRPRGYARAGHAKKLEPIITSLDFFDNNPEAWSALAVSVAKMNDGWTEILRHVECGSDEHTLIMAQRDRCVEAIRVQNTMFNQHRRTCTIALKLQCLEKS